MLLSGLLSAPKLEGKVRRPVNNHSVTDACSMLWNINAVSGLGFNLTMAGPCVPVDSSRECVSC